MVIRRSRPSPAAELPRLPQDGALDILTASQARGASRTMLAVLLLCTDRYGIVTGHTRVFGNAAGVEKNTAQVAMRQLRLLGEIEQLRKPVNRRPGMWHICALR